MNPNIRTHLNYVHGELPGDITPGGGTTQTVPDQAYTPRQLVDRHMRGLHVSAWTPVYNGDIPVPNVKAMDLTEIDDYVENLKAQNDEKIEKVKSDRRNRKRITDIETARKNASNKDKGPDGSGAV